MAYIFLSQLGILGDQCHPVPAGRLTMSGHLQFPTTGICWRGTSSQGVGGILSYITGQCAFHRGYLDIRRKEKQFKVCVVRSSIHPPSKHCRDLGFLQCLLGQVSGKCMLLRNLEVPFQIIDCRLLSYKNEENMTVQTGPSFDISNSLP